MSVVYLALAGHWPHTIHLPARISLISLTIARDDSRHTIPFRQKRSVCCSVRHTEPIQLSGPSLKSSAAEFRRFRWISMPFSRVDTSSSITIQLTSPILQEQVYKSQVTKTTGISGQKALNFLRGVQSRYPSSLLSVTNGLGKTGWTRPNPSESQITRLSSIRRSRMPGFSGLR